MTGTLAPTVLGATGGGPILGVPVRDLFLAGGLALLAFALAAAVGLGHRWYADQPVPEGLSVLVGLSGVAIQLNASTALASVIDEQAGALAIEVVAFNAGVILLSGVAAAAGGRAGDRLGSGAFALLGADRVAGDVSKVVKAVGRVVTVDLPGEIEDIEGYEPVPDATKAEFAGATLVFPRRLTVEELRKRLVDRLKTDHGVGYVDVELDESGTVDYLAVGSRESGLGPSLPPGTAAVAVRADPPFATRAGDLVQVFAPGADGGDPERVTTAELRGTAGDTVTLVVDEADAAALDDGTRYRLATLPTTPRADREFASLLRAAEETMGVATVAEGSTLVGVPAGGLSVSVAAVRPAEGPVEAIPSRDRPVAAGDTLYAIGRPAVLRRLEAAARGEAEAEPPLAEVAADDD